MGVGRVYLDHRSLGYNARVPLLYEIEPAARACVVSRFSNCGQSCIAGKRFIVLEQVAAPFARTVSARLRRLTTGDSLVGSFDLGPMARLDLRAALHHQVSRSRELGARCLLGGFMPEAVGAFYPATLLTEVTKGQPAFDEELFGPVAAIVTAPNENAAVAPANDSAYGLGAAVFSLDIRRALRVAKSLQVGVCSINDFIRSDPRLPFGGIKASG